MEIIIYSFGILTALIFIFFIIVNPYKLVVLIIFMMFYQFNYETPFFLDARGLLGILLLTRLYLLDKESMKLTNTHLFGNKFTLLIMFFTLVILVEPIINSGNVIPHIRNILLLVVSLVIGFIMVQNEEGQKLIAYGIILAGILSSIDLIYTFLTSEANSIDTIKLLDSLLGKQTFINHNYPGFLAGMGLLLIYLSWYYTEYNKNILFILVLVLSLGVLISTSRSTLLAIITVFTLMTFLVPKLRHNLKKIMSIGVVFIILLIGFYFIYTTFLSGKASNYYVHKIYYRLYEEPLQLLGGEEGEFDKWTGQRIRGSILFRADKWDSEFKKFSKLNLITQFFGLGPAGYLVIAEKIYRPSGNVRAQYAPHNGYLLILLERGILGLLLFLIIILSISISAIKVSKADIISFPFVYLLLIIVLYSFAQNAELTSAYTYLIFGCVIGNIIHAKINFQEEKEKYIEIQQSTITQDNQ